MMATPPTNLACTVNEKMCKEFYFADLISSFVSQLQTLRKSDNLKIPGYTACYMNLLIKLSAKFLKCMIARKSLITDTVIIVLLDEASTTSCPTQEGSTSTDYHVITDSMSRSSQGKRTKSVYMLIKSVMLLN